MKKKPNVLFLLTDDQRFDTIHALGNEQIITPHLDALVNDCTSFTHAHIPSGTSGAVCMPSRAMIHTGRTLYHLKDRGETLNKEFTLLGETMQKAGYNTYGIGKWHNGPDAFNRSFMDGDKIFFGGMDDHWNVPINTYDKTGAYAQRYRRCPNMLFSNNTFESISNCDTQRGVHSTDLFSKTAVDYIQNYNQQDPFFMYVAFMAPHDPRTMPQMFKDMYTPENIKVPENFMEEHPFDYGVSDIRDEVLTPYPRTKKEVQRHLAEYYGMISHLDARIGDIIQALKDKDMYEDTIIVLAGDNGLALGQHGLFGKQSCYEHSIRIPLLLKGPGIPKNKQTDAYVYLLDIYPTLCDLLDIEIPPSVDGKSFLNALLQDDPGRPYIYAGYDYQVRSVKDRQYKYIEYRYQNTRHEQLFDLTADPCEMHNLASVHPDIVKNLQQKMIEFCVSWEELSHPVGKEFWAQNV